LLKIAHERNDKAERLAKHEYFKEKEQRERYENALFRQERGSYGELRAVAMLDAEFEVHAHKAAMSALYFILQESPYFPRQQPISRASQRWDMRLVRSSRFWALLDKVRVALRGYPVSVRVVTDPGLRSLQQKFTLVPCYMTIFERAWRNGQQRNGVLQTLYAASQPVHTNCSLKSPIPNCSLNSPIPNLGWYIS